jgi:type II secretory pathway pseudopilin PulG
MIKGGSTAANAGFTIVETMIVLAVTGTMLLMAMIFVTGRQNRTEFQTSINQLQQQIQEIVNQTASGHYNNNSNFTCNGVGTLVVLGSGGNAQGTNASCIFLGNALQFGTGANDLASNLGIIPIVGRQYSTGAQSIQTVSEAKPRAVYPVGAESTPTDAVNIEIMKYGLTVAASTPGCPTGGMCYTSTASGSNVAAGTVAFISGDQSGKIAAPDGTNLKPGSQQLTLYGVKGTTPNQDTAAVAQALGNFSDVSGTVPQGLEPARGANICIASGTTDQSGLIKITADLHVTLQIYRGATCA